MLVARTHYGTKNLNFMMKDYVFRRNKEGVHIINLAKTWEKLVLAARIIVAILVARPSPAATPPEPSPTRSPSSSVSPVC